MATASTGWSCVHTTSTSSNTDTSIKITVTCYWKNEGWKYDMNNVSAWVYCGSQSKKVKDNGSIDTTSDNHGKFSMGSATFTISKTTSSQSIKCYAKITSSSSYVSGTKSSSSTNVSVSAKTSYEVSYNANGGSGAPGSQTKWYGTTLTLSNTKPTRSGYTFMGWGTSASDTSVDYSAGGSYTSNAAITLYAIWKRTITLSYNANGGSGAPGSQSTTVYNATTSYNFTISTTKPTRTGYTFLGWSTSNSASSSSYSAGGSITLSSSTTLYAIWKVNTWTVSYNANGGSGAPSSQTKTYGQTLTLSSTIPTRTNYNFKGWATSASGNVVYSAGGSYTSNAAITLYAVWKLAYTKPRITNFKAYRCTEDGTADDTGTYIKVSFDWSTYSSSFPVSKIVIQYESLTDYNWIDVIITTSDTTNGSVSEIIGDGGISIESVYNVKAYVTDSSNTTTYSDTLFINSAKFPIDIKAEGTGIAFGKVADREVFDIGYDIAYLPCYTYLGGSKVNSPNEKCLYFYNSEEDGGYFHKSKIYGGNTNSTIAIGLLDTKRRERIWGYVDDDENEDYYLSIGASNTRVIYNTAGFYSPDEGGIYFDQYGNINSKYTMTTGNWRIMNNGVSKLKLDWASSNIFVPGSIFSGNKTTNDGSSTTGICIGNYGAIQIARGEGGNPYVGLYDVSNGTNVIWGKIVGSSYCSNMTGYFNINYSTEQSSYRLYVNGASYISGALTTNNNVTVGGKLYVDNESIRSQYIYNNNNVSNSPNMYITSNGWFRRTTGSSQRWKTDITEEIEDRLNPEVLYDLPIKQFKYKDEFISDDDVRKGKNILGFIAEDVAKIYEPAAQYDEDGNVEMWNAQVMIPAMLKLIQNLKQEINDLKGGC